VLHDFYPGGRHEMLNETNREEVRARLLGWIYAVLEGGGVEARSAASTSSGRLGPGRRA
jgi:hypothetical protein